MTIFGPVLLTILAVLVSVMVIGSGPQLKVITPPLATAATTASPVQLAGVPSPTTERGVDTSSRPASAGTMHLPSGLPAGGPIAGIIIDRSAGAPAKSAPGVEARSPPAPWSPPPAIDPPQPAASTTIPSH